MRGKASIPKAMQSGVPSGASFLLRQKEIGGEIMLVTREQLIKRLAEETGFWQKDIRSVLQCLDTLMPEYFNMATEDDDVSIQLFEGCKVGCSIVPERVRVQPKTREEIVCKPTVKPRAKFSINFRQTIQQNYDEKMGK
jgi:nucleoid DNA-binding protein